MTLIYIRFRLAWFSIMSQLVTVTYSCFIVGKGITVVTSSVCKHIMRWVHANEGNFSTGFHFKRQIISHMCLHACEMWMCACFDICLQGRCTLCIHKMDWEQQPLMKSIPPALFMCFYTVFFCPYDLITFIFLSTAPGLSIILLSSTEVRGAMRSLFTQ